MRVLGQALLALPVSVRRLWTRARDRVFDIGIEATMDRAAIAVALQPETVRTMARLNARIAFTVYPGTSRQQRPSN
jgi:hypothetical protein